MADGEGFDAKAWGRRAEDEMRDRAGGVGDGGPGGGVPYILFRDAQPLMASGWLVKGLLPASGLAAVYGPSGCGKTFVALDMLLHIAAGMPWRGLRTKRTGVLYLSPDGGRAVQNRLAAWRQHHGVTEADFALAPGSVDLLGKIAAGDVDAVLEAIADIERQHGFKIGVVAVDTVSRAMPGGDENRPEDMTGFITNVARLHQDGERLGMVIHHTPKSDATVLRGHSSLHGACDCELNVADRAIRVAKQRDGAADAVHGFDLKVIELGHDEDGDAVTSCVAVAADAPEGKERPLSAGKQIALNTLRTLIAKAGRELPDGPNYPRKSRGFGHTLGVNLSGFRDEFFNLCEPGQSPDTKSKAFRRALKDLQAIGKVAVYDDWIWCPDKPVNGGVKSGHSAAQESASSGQIFCPGIASLFGLGGSLLRPDLRSPQPSRAAAVKEARRAPRSGAQRPGRPRARRHAGRRRTRWQLSGQTTVTPQPPATETAVVCRLGADLAAIAVRF